jgi:hypothetical protein
MESLGLDAPAPYGCGAPLIHAPLPASFVKPVMGLLMGLFALLMGFLGLFGAFLPQTGL